MKKQSNIYALIYSVGLVLVVGVVLSLIYQSLRPQQEENEANDMKSQILKAALISGEGKDIPTLYAEHIRSSYIVDYHGNIVNRDADDAFAACRNMSDEIKKPQDARLLPVFECQTDNGLKYIIPVYGAGLWGPMATPSTALTSPTRGRPRVWARKLKNRLSALSSKAKMYSLTANSPVSVYASPARNRKKGHT